MSILFFYVMLVLILTTIASKKGNGFVVFFFSLVLSPIVGLLFLVGMSDKTRNKCPECDELISADANVCCHCGFDLRKVNTAK